VLRRWPIAAVVVAALGVAAVATAAPATITTINTGATANLPARRVPPPGPHIDGCPILPATNAWNTEIASAPLHPLSAQIISHVGASKVHPDVGSTFGIPFVVVPGTQSLVPIEYGLYGDESDPGPFPIPLDAPIEGDGQGDSHVIALQLQTCQLYELFSAHRTTNGWFADSGAHFDLLTGAPRPVGWTSADAAGLPILPGLVRYDEVAAGLINHAIRVTFSQTQKGFIPPASHSASNNSDPTLPAMGMRFRLRADYPIAGLTGQARVIAIAMQQYGLMVADNGSNWFFQGAPDPRWNDEDLDQLKAIPGTAFEVVDTGPVQTG
jgi:hypothetical protein